MKKKRKKRILILLLLIGLILVGTGTSLAYFSYKEDIGNKILLGDDIYIELIGDDEIVMNPDPAYMIGPMQPIVDYEFSIVGHNTNNKPIYYAIYLDYGEEIPGMSRIKDNDIIATITNYNDFTQKSKPIDSIELPIYIGKIDGGSSEDTQLDFEMQLFLNSLSISDTDPNADYSASTEGIINNGKPRLSDTYGSYGVRLEASTKEIKMEELPYFKNNYEVLDSLYVNVSSPLSLGTIVQMKSLIDFTIERPTASTTLLYEPGGGNGSRFLVEYIEPTSTFDFYLGWQEYHFQYLHNDADVEDGIDKINIVIDMENDIVKINNQEFSIAAGSLEGSSGEYIEFGTGVNQNSWLNYNGYTGKLFGIYLEISEYRSNEIVAKHVFDYKPALNKKTNEVILYDMENCSQLFDAFSLIFELLDDYGIDYSELGY